MSIKCKRSANYFRFSLKLKLICFKTVIIIIIKFIFLYLSIFNAKSPLPKLRGEQERLEHRKIL